MKVYARLRDQGGFTLIEVMIAAVILAIGVMGYMLLLTNSIASRSFATEMNQATLAGSGFAEEILLSGYNSANLQAGAHQTTKTVGNRVVTLDWMVYDACPTSLTKLVQITASWTEDNKVRALNLTEVRGNW